MPRFAPITITALLATLVFIFAFQADNITNRFFHVLLIAVPITLQVYFNASPTGGQAFRHLAAGGISGAEYQPRVAGC